MTPGLAALTVIAAVAAIRLVAGGSRLREVAIIALTTTTALMFSHPQIRRDLVSVKNHAQTADKIREQLDALHCPGIRWATIANRSTLAELTGRSVEASGHPLLNLDPAQLLTHLPQARDRE
jgi:hypothetical protein